MAKTTFIGKIFYNKKHEEFKIIEKLNIKNKYLCEFNDGTLVGAFLSNIKNGSILNPNAVSVFGIGIKGISEIEDSFRKEYNLWYNIIKRCYSQTALNRRPTYRGCSICERWAYFKNFLEDVQQLPNYSEWKADTNKRNSYEIDKDIKHSGNKVYSKDNCTFVKQGENKAEMNKRTKITGKTYVATRIEDGYKEEFTNQREFNKKYSLNSSNVWKCITKQQKAHNGWEINIKETVVSE